MYDIYHRGPYLHSADWCREGVELQILVVAIHTNVIACTTCIVFFFAGAFSSLAVRMTLPNAKPELRRVKDDHFSDTLRSLHARPPSVASLDVPCRTGRFQAEIAAAIKIQSLARRGIAWNRADDRRFDRNKQVPSLPLHALCSQQFQHNWDCFTKSILGLQQ